MVGERERKGEAVSVLIKGMEMPKNCKQCFYRGSGCRSNKHNNGRPQDCLLIEIPPHGRLIDAAEISEHKYTTIPSYRKKYADGKPKSSEEIIAFKLGWNYAIDAIVENAPTIITASDKDINVLGKEEPTQSNTSNALDALREEKTCTKN